MITETNVHGESTCEREVLTRDISIIMISDDDTSFSDYIQPESNDDVSVNNVEPDVLILTPISTPAPASISAPFDSQSESIEVFEEESDSESIEVFEESSDYGWGGFLVNNLGAVLLDLAKSAKRKGFILEQEKRAKRLKLTVI